MRPKKLRSEPLVSYSNDFLSKKLGNMPDAEEGLCKRCAKSGGVLETPLHRFWQCPDNCNAGPIVQETEHLGKWAVKHSQELVIFWLRGIPTAKMMEVEEAPESCEVWQAGDPSTLQRANLRVYTDGSGGPHSGDLLLRRCGWSWIIKDEGGGLAFARFSALAGRIQTVPRAELSALVDLVAVVEPTTNLSVVIDAKYVVDNGTKIIHLVRTTGAADRHPAMTGPHGDLWMAFYQSIKDRGGTVTLTWIKSHATATMIWSGYVGEGDFVGNALADVFADRAAKEA